MKNIFLSRKSTSVLVHGELWLPTMENEETGGSRGFIVKRFFILCTKQALYST